MKQIRILLLLLLTPVFTLNAQVLDPVKWKFDSKNTGNGEYELLFTARIDAGWHMYGLNIPGDGPVPTSFHFSENNDISFLNELTPKKQPEVKFDPTFEMNVELFSNEITFSRKVKVPAGEVSKVEGSVEFMVCDDTRCLPPKEMEFSIPVGEKKKENKQEKVVSQSNQKPKIQNLDVEQTDSIITESGPIPSDTAISVTTIKAEGEVQPRSLWGLFWLAFIAGFSALITPCVYPIIPLTISFFMRDVSRSKAIFNGLFFGLSIIFIYTMVGLLVGLLRINLVNLITSHWLPNVIFFLLFIVLALSFFGLYEITLPGSMSNSIDRQADKGGFWGPFFMALATSVISFSCTGIIVGSVLGKAMMGEVLQPVIGMLGYSISFALPFTLLAIFPGFMKKLPKSGGWLNTVKIFFAFVLLIFSLVFIVNLHLSFINREVILSIAIVMLVLLGLNLAGKLRFSHDSALESISVMRLLFIIAVFSSALYLITGFFGAPLKAISPFLPEKSVINTTGIQAENTEKADQVSTVSICDENPKYSDFLDLPLGLTGYHDYDEALACAAKMNKPVLLDFAGHSCKNCKKMYAEVWSDPRVLEKLRNDFIVAVLYTDDRTKIAEEDWITSSIDGKIKNTVGKKFNNLQIEKFGSNALPLYAIVDANGNILTSEKYYTYSPNVEAFLNFLNEAE